MERREEEEERKTTVQSEEEEEEGEEEEEAAAWRGDDENDDEDSDGDEEQKDKDGGDDDDDDDDKIAAGIKTTKQKVVVVTSCPDRKCVPGIIYLGHIPPRLRPKHLRNLLSVYGEIGRIFLQPEGSLYISTHIIHICILIQYIYCAHTHKYCYSTYTHIQRKTL